MTTKTERSYMAVLKEQIARGLRPKLYKRPKGVISLEEEMRQALLPQFRALVQPVIKATATREVTISNSEFIMGVQTGAARSLEADLATTYYEHDVKGARLGFSRSSRLIRNVIGSGPGWEEWKNSVTPIMRARADNASRHLLNRVNNDVSRVLVTGAREGHDITAIRNGLMNVEGKLTRYQATTIARTEINGAMNEAANVAYDAADVQWIQWISAQDNRVRPSHLGNHGLVIRRGGVDTFFNGMKYPGDQSVGVGEWINERCTSVAYFPLVSEIAGGTPFYGRAIF